MHIWVDADACPAVIKEILFRASQRTQIPTTLVANHAMRIPNQPQLRFIQVTSGFDVADNFIVQQLQPDDLVITADIPLAAEVIEKKGVAINPRGTLYTESNIRQRLAMRNFMEEMRSIGQASGGPPPLSQTDRQAFANSLDRLLAKYKHSTNTD
ncbi:MAG: YaiI/YqxD family protein [Pseudomonadales bacterium]|nr:YaiI/YqxD family protein [Pseudomonadales bacterium]MCP5215540.1 YaiI/YqxD family protein [Pseudomonadales bacterium]